MNFSIFKNQVIVDELDTVLKNGESLSVKRVNDSTLLITVDKVCVAVDVNNKFYMVNIKDSGWIGSVEDSAIRMQGSTHVTIQ